MPTFPHLTDTEDVRKEAADQYGGLTDAAAFTAAHRASLDPNVTVAGRRARNEEATAELQGDLTAAQSKIDEAFGDGEYTVLDAAVRGDALSVIVEDTSGRPTHKVVGWNDNWKPLPGTEHTVNAEAEAARGRLGAEARAEVQRIVQEATAEAVAKVTEMFSSKSEEIDKVRDEAVQEATEEEDTSDERRAALNAGLVPTPPTPETPQPRPTTPKRASAKRSSSSRSSSSSSSEE